MAYGEPCMGPRVTAGTAEASFTVASGYMFFGGLMCRSAGSWLGCMRLCASGCDRA